MGFALVTVPFVFPAEFLGAVELAEAIGDGDLIDEEIIFLNLLAKVSIEPLLLQEAHECLMLVLAANQKFVESPTYVFVELHDDLEILIQVWDLWGFYLGFLAVGWLLFCGHLFTIFLLVFVLRSRALALISFPLFKGCKSLVILIIIHAVAV